MLYCKYTHRKTSRPYVDFRALVGAKNDQLKLKARDSHFRFVTAHTLSISYKPSEPPEPFVVCSPGPLDVKGGLEPTGVVENPGVDEVME